MEEEEEQVVAEVSEVEAEQGPIQDQAAAVEAVKRARSRTHIPIDAMSAAPSAYPGCDPGSRPTKAVQPSLKGFPDPCIHQDSQ
ncbi:hypothetical protein M5D96_013798 [Drosophila gunungcola]|uniref:Uncharacterized protein n=1 Tax=Drosophila gunungcola TaxID=103775 RepID=A0A9P9YB61_9MUSC|nr:hypothetical protein M5D96_013798 [Drosophila gunungcola]